MANFLGNMLKKSPRSIHITLLFFAVFLVYVPGLNGQFQFDDYPNIVNNTRLHIQTLSLKDLSTAALSSDSGRLKRPVSMLSFALNHYFFTLNPFAYKLTNVVIHLFNTISIYFLSILLLKIHFRARNSYSIAFVIAIAWGCHPINLTSVLYVVQRMTSLSAFFTISGMISYLLSRQYLVEGNTKRAITGFIVTLLLGFLSLFSKENGALLFVFLFLIETILFQDHSILKKQRITINLFFCLTLLTPVLVIFSYSVINPEWISKGYGTALAFSLYERVLTEFRIVWLYISWVLLPNNQSLGLFHDDIVISTSLLTPISTLLAGLAHISFISLLVYLWLKKQVPYFVFGCSLFYASHLIESTILPLQLAHEHRNYLGSFGLLFAFLSLCIKNKKVLTYGISLYIVFLCLLTTQRSMTWADGLTNALIEVEHHPNSYSAQNEAGRQYGKLIYFVEENLTTKEEEIKAKALQHFKKAAELNKTKADAIFGIVVTLSRKQGALPDTLIKELTHRLSTGPVFASYPSWLASLIKCHIDKICHISGSTLSNIIQAAVNNQNISQNPKTGSFILMVASSFAARSGNYPNALELALATIKLTPSNVIFIRYIIDLALLNKDYNTAQQWILHFEKLPYANLYTLEINSLKSQLAEI